MNRGRVCGGGGGLCSLFDGDRSIPVCIRSGAFVLCFSARFFHLLSLFCRFVDWPGNVGERCSNLARFCRFLFPRGDRAARGRAGCPKQSPETGVSWPGRRVARS